MSTVPGLRSGAPEQQIPLTKEQISLLFLEGRCQRFLGSVAQPAKVAQREPGGLYSQLLSGAMAGTKWRLVVSRRSFCNMY